MASIRISSMVGMTLASAAVVLTAVPAQAQYAQRYLFTTTTGGGATAGDQAMFLNDNGLVAGRYGFRSQSVSGKAKIWDASGTGAPVLLWTEPSFYTPGGPIEGSMAVAINNTAVLFPHMVEGVASREAVVNVWASGFNDQGLVVGRKGSVAMWANSPVGAAQAITVEGNQALAPRDVNNAGQVVGSGTFGGQTQAFVYDTTASLGRQLFDSTSGVMSSEVWDVNDAGVILGKKVLASGAASAFLYNLADGSFQDLPASSNGGSASSLQGGALNNLGQIVFDNLFFDGQSWVDLRQANGLTGKVSGLDINNKGEILVSHYYYTGSYSMGGTPLSNSYKNDYLILTTVPEPASVLSMGLGITALLIAVRRHRVRAAA